jgi:hypothetical protein
VLGAAALHLWADDTESDAALLLPARNGHDTTVAGHDGRWRHEADLLQHGCHSVSSRGACTTDSYPKAFKRTAFATDPTCSDTCLHAVLLSSIPNPIAYRQVDNVVYEYCLPTSTKHYVERNAKLVLSKTQADALSFSKIVHIAIMVPFIVGMALFGKSKTLPGPLMPMMIAPLPFVAARSAEQVWEGGVGCGVLRAIAVSLLGWVFYVQFAVWLFLLNQN